MGSAAAPSLLWFVARGSGVVAFVLLTATVALGIAVSRHWHGERWPRLVVEGAHRWLTLTFVAFIVVHTVTVLLDPFTHFGLRDVTLPFGSQYRTLWLGLGVLTSELALAIAASALVRRWLDYRVWHGLHLLTYVLFPLALLHGMGTGTDTATSWATVLYAGSAAVVASVLIWRTMELRALRRWVLAATLAGGTALVVWGLRGPYANGWAAAAGTPKALLQAAAQQRGLAGDAATPAPTPSVPQLPRQLQDTVSGQALMGQDRSLLLRGTGTGSVPLDVAVQLVQSRRSLGGQVQLRTGDHTPLCAGPITGISGGNTILATCSGYGQQVELQLIVQQLDDQGFVGVLRSGG